MRLIRIAVLAVTALVLAGCGTAQATTPQPSPSVSTTPPRTALQAAASSCLPIGSTTFQVVDSGNSLLVNGLRPSANSSSTMPSDWERLACVLVAIDTPIWVGAELDSTRALDGRRTASWDSYTASWSYHPKSGLDLVLRTVNGS